MMNMNLVNGVRAVQTARDYGRLPGYLNMPQAETTGVVHEYTSEGQLSSDVLNKRAELTAGLEVGDAVLLRGFVLSEKAPEKLRAETSPVAEDSNAAIK
ncbi:MAG TPA: hypothetical protein VF914_19685 [Chloroflexia bacterium]